MRVHFQKVEYGCQGRWVKVKVTGLNKRVRVSCQRIHCFLLKNTEHIAYSGTRQLWSSNAGLLAKPKTSIKTADRAFAVVAATVWNSLPGTVRTATTSAQFTRLLERHISSHLADRALYRVVLKIARSLIHRNFAIVCSRVISEIN